MKPCQTESHILFSLINKGDNHTNINMYCKNKTKDLQEYNQNYKSEREKMQNLVCFWVVMIVMVHIYTHMHPLSSRKTEVCFQQINMFECSTLQTLWMWIRSLIQTSNIPEHCSMPCYHFCIISFFSCYYLHLHVN
jgi:hypothetical protein